MIRVLFVLPNLQGGGAERVALDLMRHLDRRQFAPVLFLLKREGVYWDEVPSDVPVTAGIDTGRLRRRFGTVLSKLVSEARHSDIIVGALELDATYFAYAAARVARKPLVAWVHTVLDRFVQNAGGPHGSLARFLYPRVSVTVVPSEGAAESLRRFGVSPDRMVKIPNVLDASRVKRRGEEAPGVLLPSGKDALLAVGRLDHGKGFDLLIEAHALLRRRGLDHFVLIAGKGPEQRHLEELAGRLGVSDTVMLLGFVPNPYALMRSARLLVLPSRFEGLPVVLLEAMALGLPVVAADCPSGPREILEDGRLGRLVPPEDPAALAEAIGDVLQSRGALGDVQQQVAQRVRAFAPERVVPVWEELLLAQIR